MDAVDLFKNRANAALTDLGALADELAAKQGYRERLDQIGARFEQMNADGVIDPAELNELMALFEGSGLDTTGLRDADSSELSKLIHERLDLAKNASAVTTTDRFRAQLAMQEIGDNVRAASEVSSARHRTYMSVIRNLIA